MKQRTDTELRGVMRHDEPLAHHTSWRVGGPVRCFYQPADRDDLVNFLRQLSPDEPVFWLGLGSNLLVRDAGLRGTVIATSGALNDLKRMEGHLVYAEVGVACPKVAKFSARQNLSGAEFLCGIPGTVGGALAMNAGAFGGETWSIVKSVRTVDRLGNVHERTADEYEIGYRHVKGPSGEWFLAATLSLQAGDGEQSQKMIKTLLAKRGSTQPTQQANAGSVFRNPDNDHAARLIEASGLKGYCIGGACVSDKHANFIVNTGTATAGDIESLIEYVQAQVREQQGVELQREVHIVGETD